MTKRMLIDAVQTEESRVVIIDGETIEEYDFVTSTKKQIKGNIYLAKITRVEPSLQAAFVEYGGNKQGFLPFAEIHPDYYQIPISDRKRLIEEQEAQARAEEEAEMAEDGEYFASQTDATFPQQQEPVDSSAEHFPEDSDPIQPFSGEETSAFLQNLSSQTASEELVPPSEIEEAQADSLASEYTAHPDVEYAAESTGFSDVQYAPHTTSTDSDGTPVNETAEPLPENIEEANTSNEIETLGNEEETARPARRPQPRRYKIQEVIKRNQIVLVQVIKEERGNKGVSLTTYMSLPGRYCVLMPNSPKDGGISRKIASSDDRRRLKQISSELRTSRGMSVIIRTAGTDRTRAEIKRDYEYLVKLWDNIREQTIHSTAPALIYEEGDLVKRSIRDSYNNDIEEILVEGDQAFVQAKEFMKMLMPSHAPRVKHYRDSTPLFYQYEVEDQLVLMYDPVVKLRSGGYIVINPTEALTSIDVNSGRSTTERNIEETAVKTNQEAAYEIARQIRLRDLAGLVVIDFIDMMDSRNRRSIERALKDALRLDRAKIQIGRISPFGLLEMSRQRLRPSIAETSTTTCGTCQGKGFVRAPGSMAIQILRALKKDASSGMFSELRLIASSSTALYLLNSKRDAITALEEAFQTRITVQIQEDVVAVGFRIEKVKLHSSERRRRLEGRKENVVSTATLSVEDMETIDEAVLTEETLMDDFPESDSPEGATEERFQPRRNANPRGPRRGRGGRNRGPRFDRNSENAPVSSGEDQTGFTENSDENTSFNASEPSAEGGDENRPPRGNRNRNRGRGNNRRWRGKGDRPPRNQNQEGGGTSDSTQGYSPAGSEQGGSFRPEPVGGSFAPSSWNTPQSSPEPHRSYPSGGSGSQTESSGGGEGGDAAKGTKKGWWRRIVES